MAESRERARVFISCGQAEGVEEDTAIQIGEVLRNEFGLEPYVAGKQISFQGVKEAIFRQLPESEYFLFVDFPREKLPDGTCRGSLFANQELAIAAYLELDFLGFRHQSVRALDGLLRFIQAGFPVFDNPAQLLGQVRQSVTDAGWTTGWKNGLRLERRADEWDDVMAGWQEDGSAVAARQARFFHLDVFNAHRSRIALGCVGYVESMRDMDRDQDIAFRSSEIKWAGSRLAVVSVPSRVGRMLDACVLRKDDPTTVYFVSYSDSGEFMAPVRDVRNLQVGYVVVSENMPAARAILCISLGDSIDDVRVIDVRSSASP